jgi:hypothetical protein
VDPGNCFFLQPLDNFTVYTVSNNYHGRSVLLVESSSTYSESCISFQGMYLPINQELGGRNCMAQDSTGESLVLPQQYALAP